MTDDSPLTVSYPSVSRKKVTAAFDGGRLSSDSGVMLLALAERRRALAKTLAALIADQRDVAHITHTVEDVLKARMLAIACGYPDGNDFDWLRSDPAFSSPFSPHRPAFPSRISNSANPREFATEPHRSPAGPAPPPMAEARHVMRKSARTTRLEAVTALHRRHTPKAMTGRLSWTSSYSFRRSKAVRDAPSVGLFIATAIPNAAKPRRYRHQSP